MGKNTGVSCHYLLQGTLWIQGLNLRLLHLMHWQADSLPLGNPFRIIREFKVDMYTMLNFKWITSKDLLYSTGNFAQCYVAAWMGGDLEENGCLYIWLSSFGVHLKLSQHCLLAILQYKIQSLKYVYKSLHRNIQDNI